jgi:hypothetical protein
MEKKGRCISLLIIFLILNGIRYTWTFLGDQNIIISIASQPITISTTTEARGGGGCKNATKCLCSLERYLNGGLIDQWLRDEVPLLERVFTYNNKLHILLALEHLNAAKRGKLFWIDGKSVRWFCGHVEEGTPLVANVLHFGPKSRVGVLTCPVSVPNKHHHQSHNVQLWALDRSDYSTLVSYDLSPFLSCEAEETKLEEAWAQNLSFAACVIFRGEEAHRTLHEWFAYHRLVGIQHFWAYVNEDFNDVMNDLPKLPFVTYVYVVVL